MFEISFVTSPWLVQPKVYGGMKGDGLVVRNHYSVVSCVNEDPTEFGLISCITGFMGVIVNVLKDGEVVQTFR